jgi:predicted phage tail protein
MDATITEIAGGVSPSRVTQPKQSTKNIKGKFIPALAFTNTLDASDVSFAQIKYRPEQGDGEATLSEIGFFIGGRDQIEEPSNIGVSFDDWQAAGYTSTKGWSSNTAWVFFDYLTNTTFGLGNDIVLDDQQKADLYEDIYLAARWTNLAPDSGQPLIPVSRFNGIIYGAESKFEALQKIADAMFAKFVYLNGNPRLVFDGRAFAWSTYTPTIKKLVNQTSAANIMYQSGSIDNIFNVINVTWNNPANYFRTENVQYKNTASIAKYGERETSIELTGCTNKQMALWHGAWMYETEASNAETVTYIAGWDHFDVLPGDLIHLNDGLRVDTTTVGARVSAVGATLTLDRDCGVGTIAVTDTSGNIQQGSVNGTSALMLAGTFQVDAVANVYSGTFEANYRVIAIEESEDGIYAVTAQKHDPDKYTRIWANTV